MNHELPNAQDNPENLELQDKTRVVTEWTTNLQEKGYILEEINEEKPWGGYIRLNNDDAEQFIGEYFPGLTLEEAKLGLEDVELSPKILIVTSGERLSWQKHDRRAERWAYLTEGGYHKSITDEEGELHTAQPGEVVQFQQGERHRLVGTSDSEFTLVAEIWQHVDPENPSDEGDIVRIQDDYKR